MVTPTAKVAPHFALKDTMRAAARLRRAGCDPAWGMRLAGHVLVAWPPSPGQVVAGFWPVAGEIDVRPLLLALAGRGHTLALPETPPPGEPLIFRHWRPGDRLVPGRFGTVRSAGEILVPDVLLVPLLAFDRSGHRLGYGGGYYDRTLAALRDRRALGCAFSAQEVDQVPAGDWDQTLDAVATEQEVIVTRRGGATAAAAGPPSPAHSAPSPSR